MIRLLDPSPRLRLSALTLFTGLAVFSVQAAFAQSAPTGSLGYSDDPGPPAGGVLLPVTPNPSERIRAAIPLGTSFQNSCFANAQAGAAEVLVNAASRTIIVDFDESTATFNPICDGVFLPVSFAVVELDPLPAGDWTIQVDSIFDAFPGLPPLEIPPQTIDFTVAAAAPSVGASLIGSALLTFALAATSARAIRRKAPSL